MNQKELPRRGRSGLDEEGIPGPWNCCPSSNETGIYPVIFAITDLAGRDSTMEVDAVGVPLPPSSLTPAPTNPDNDGLYEDLDADGTAGFSDVVLRNREWVTEQESVGSFDPNGNGRIDFNDVVKLFQEL